MGWNKQSQAHTFHAPDAIFGPHVSQPYILNHTCLTFVSHEHDLSISAAGVYRQAGRWRAQFSHGGLVRTLFFVSQFFSC